jgi:hypothetical protein
MQNEVVLYSLVGSGHKLHINVWVNIPVGYAPIAGYTDHFVRRVVEHIGRRRRRLKRSMGVSADQVDVDALEINTAAWPPPIGIITKASLAQLHLKTHAGGKQVNYRRIGMAMLIGYLTKIGDEAGDCLAYSHALAQQQWP